MWNCTESSTNFSSVKLYGENVSCEQLLQLLKGRRGQRTLGTSAAETGSTEKRKREEWPHLWRGRGRTCIYRSTFKTDWTGKDISMDLISHPVNMAHPGPLDPGDSTLQHQASCCNPQNREITAEGEAVSTGGKKQSPEAEDPAKVNKSLHTHS